MSETDGIMNMLYSNLYFTALLFYLMLPNINGLIYQKHA